MVSNVSKFVPILFHVFLLRNAHNPNRKQPDYHNEEWTLCPLCPLCHLYSIYGKSLCGKILQKTPQRKNFDRLNSYSKDLTYILFVKYG